MKEKESSSLFKHVSRFLALSPAIYWFLFSRPLLFFHNLSPFFDLPSFYSLTLSSSFPSSISISAHTLLIIRSPVKRRKQEGLPTPPPPDPRMPPGAATSSERRDDLPTGVAVNVNRARGERGRFRSRAPPSARDFFGGEGIFVVPWHSSTAGG